MHTFTPRGVCSRAIHLELDGERVAHVDFVGGCDGNLKAIAKLVEGMTVDEVAAALEGNTCGRREARAKELAGEAGVEAGADAPHEAV